MATAKKTASKTPQLTMKSLDERIKKLEDIHENGIGAKLNNVEIPKSLDETKGKLTTWTRENPLGALLVTGLIFLIIGGILF